MLNYPSNRYIHILILYIDRQLTSCHSLAAGSGSKRKQCIEMIGMFPQFIFVLTEIRENIVFHLPCTRQLTGLKVPTLTNNKLSFSGGIQFSLSPGHQTVFTAFWYITSGPVCITFLFSNILSVLQHLLNAQVVSLSLSLSLPSLSHSSTTLIFCPNPPIYGTLGCSHFTPAVNTRWSLGLQFSAVWSRNVDIWRCYWKSVIPLHSYTIYPSPIYLSPYVRPVPGQPCQVDAHGPKHVVFTVIRLFTFCSVVLVCVLLYPCCLQK